MCHGSGQSHRAACPTLLVCGCGFHARLDGTNSRQRQGRGLCLCPMRRLAHRHATANLSIGGHNRAKVWPIHTKLNFFGHKPLAPPCWLLDILAAHRSSIALCRSCKSLILIDLIHDSTSKNRLQQPRWPLSQVFFRNMNLKADQLALSLALARNEC